MTDDEQLQRLRKAFNRLELMVTVIFTAFVVVVSAVSVMSTNYAFTGRLW